MLACRWLSSACVLIWRAEREANSHVSSYKGTNPIVRAPRLWPNQLEKAPSPNTIVLGTRVSIYEFGVGHKHVVHSTLFSSYCSLVPRMDKASEEDPCHLLYRSVSEHHFHAWGILSLNKQSPLLKVASLAFLAARASVYNLGPTFRQQHPKF